MFAPRDFYTLARSLLRARPAEAAHRSATSRAYYAAFLSARNQTIGEEERGPRVHQLVITALHARGLAHTATELQALRYLRNRADYDLTTTHTPDTARTAVATAAHILRTLAQRRA